MDFKEFLLLEGDAEESKDQAKKREEKRKEFKPRPNDPKAPESTPIRSTASTLAKITHGSLKAVKNKRDKVDADTTVRIAASTDLTNPILKRLSEIVENLVERGGIVSATEVVDKGAPTSTQAAKGMYKLTRKIRTGDSAARGAARGQSAGAAVGRGVMG